MRVRWWGRVGGCGKKEGLTAASAGCPHRLRASKNKPAARLTPWSFILLRLLQLLQHPHEIPGWLWPTDIILRVYWARARAWKGERGCPNCAGRLRWGERSFYRVEGGKKKKLFFPPPPLLKAGLLGVLFPSVQTCKLFPHANPTDLLSSLSSPAPPPPHQLWGIWGSLRHSFKLQQQPAREWRSVIWGRETPRPDDWPLWV